MQVELLDRRRWSTRIELANAIFEHLEIFHNRQRRHTALKMRTPIEYEESTTTTTRRLFHVAADASPQRFSRTRRTRSAVTSASGRSAPRSPTTVPKVWA